MGDRAQVRFVFKDKSHDVYFYTHWTGYLLAEDIKRALTRGKDRWDDSEYLARIIFSEMIQSSVMDTTCFGIGYAKHGDLQHDLITVDCSNKTVLVPGYGNWSFETYVNMDSSYIEGY